jgi:hypothetical protein
MTGLPPRPVATRSARSRTIAWAATRTSACPSASRAAREYVKDYQADGFLINSVKSCNSFSAGQLLMLRELEKRTGCPAASSRATSSTRATSAANVKNRVESYLQMIEQKRGKGPGATPAGAKEATP